MVCNTTIGGNLLIADSGRSAPWNLGQCGGNTVAGYLTFRSNAGTGNVLSGNSIKGSLACTGSGSVAAAGNKVSGRTEGQCAE